MLASTGDADTQLLEIARDKITFCTASDGEDSDLSIHNGEDGSVRAAFSTHQQFAKFVWERIVLSGECGLSGNDVSLSSCS